MSHEKRIGKAAVLVDLEELLNLQKQARQFSFDTLKKHNKNTGMHSSHLLARGMEFAESRHYLPGDDVRNIDWRVTARTGKTHTKLFSAEKENKIILAVDLRSPMYFATKGVFKSVQASLLASLIGWNTSEKGDRIGGIIFNDETVFLSKPHLGKKGLFPLLETMSTWSAKHIEEKEHVQFSKSLRMDEAILNLKHISSTGSIIFIISDFRHFSDLAKNLVLQIALQADVFLCFVYDALEANFIGKGHFPITAGGVIKQLYVKNEASVQKYKEEFSARRERVESLRRNSRIHFLECSTECDCLSILKRR
jgi:uncharacterized protein (DUF58 family)